MVWAVTRLVDCQCPATEWLRLAHAVGGPQQFGEVVDTCRNIGIVCAVARLIYRQRSPIQRLRLDVSSFGSQQYPEIVHQTRRWFADFATIRMLDDHPHMRCERVEARPGSNVLRISREGFMQPRQRLDQSASALPLNKAAPRH